jgi:hypothetical protein
MKGSFLLPFLIKVNIDFMPAYQKKGFIVGLALFFILLFIPAPEGLNITAWTVAAIAGSDGGLVGN